MCIVIVLFKYVSDFWDMSGSELGEWHQSGQSQLVTLFRGRQLTVTSVIMAELIANQHCLHTIELGNSALLTPRTLYVGWLFKMDFPSMFFSFLWSLIWKQALMEGIQMELNVRCHTEIKLSAILQLSLDRTLFSFALIKNIHQTLLRVGDLMSSRGCFH